MTTLEERLVTQVGEFIEQLVEEQYNDDAEQTTAELLFLEFTDTVLNQWPVPQRCPSAVYVKYVKAAAHLMGLRHAIPEFTEDNVWNAIQELSHEVITAIEADSQKRVPVIDWRKEGF